jgi:CRP-like cAMP-binding protein
METEEYFAGQQIVTQGEVGDAYFVLRRGKCEVHVDQKLVGSLAYGTGFGELALVSRRRHRLRTLRCGNEERPAPRSWRRPGRPP